MLVVLGAFALVDRLDLELAMMYGPLENRYTHDATGVAAAIRDSPRHVAVSDAYLTVLGFPLFRLVRAVTGGSSSFYMGTNWPLLDLAALVADSVIWAYLATFISGLNRSQLSSPSVPAV